jgi:hypothetical protein
MVSICSYGVYPYYDPLLIDDVSLELNDSLENILNSLFNYILSQPPSMLEDNPLVNPKLFMRDALTKYTVDNIFLKSTENDLIHIINTIMKKLYDVFFKETGIRLYFVYRGGNILKLYKDKFEEYLPGKVKDFFKEEFDSYFKTSDIDFYTVIEDSNRYTVGQIESINEYIQMMCYLGCNLARIFIMNNENLFNFCRLNTNALSQDFLGLIKEFNKTKSSSPEYKEANFFGLGFNRFVFTQPTYEITEVDQDDVYENFITYDKCGRFDLMINPLGDKAEITTIPYVEPKGFEFGYLQQELVEKNGILDFYISWNQRIQNKEDKIEFSLVRLMLNFLVMYQVEGKTYFTNAPSELFDLSIGHPNDKMFYVYSSDQLTEYTFSYGPSKKKDTIYIPSINITITDLIQILYKGKGFPWDDPKYEKRLYRLLVLIMITQLASSDLEEVKEKLEEKTKEVNFLTITEFNEDIEKRVKKKDEKKYKDYIQLYNSIVNKLLSVIDKIEGYIENKGQLGRGNILL